MVTLVGDVHFHDLIAAVVNSFSGNSRHFEQSVH